MTFMFHIEKWFDVTAHSFPTSTIHVKYKQYSAKKENIWSEQRTRLHKSDMTLIFDIETLFNVIATLFRMTLFG